MHGLGGHPEKTWSTEPAGPRESHSSSLGHREDNPAFEIAFWPRDLLAKTIKNARILTYGYDADFSSAAEHVNVFQHSRDFLIALTAQRRDNVCTHYYSA